MSLALAGGFFTTESPGKPLHAYAFKDLEQLHYLHFAKKETKTWDAT